MCNKCNGSCNSCNCTCDKPCMTPDCACKVFITTDCVTLKEELTCSNIPAGLTETEVLKQLDAYICERFTSVENFLQLVNIGSGSQIYRGINVLGKRELRTLLSDGTVTIIQNADNISFSINQNNFVRRIEIPDNELPIEYEKEDIIAYILALPPSMRTLTETDSKLNIMVVPGLT